MLDLAVVDPVKNFWIQAGARADDQDLGISVEKVQNPTGGDLANKVSQLSQKLHGRTCWYVVSYIASPDDKHILVLDLPCQD